MRFPQNLHPDMWIDLVHHSTGSYLDYIIYPISRNISRAMKADSFKHQSSIIQVLIK